MATARGNSTDMQLVRSPARRGTRRRHAWAAAAAAVLSTLPATALADNTPPSAVGQGLVTAIAVSPVMDRTGLVVAFITDSKGKNHLWVSHNSGASWQMPAAKGWNDGRPFIGTDARGHDTIYAAGSSSNTGLLRSDDGGASFVQVSPGSLVTGTAGPTYRSNGMVVGAGTPDLVATSSGQKTVKGSSGANQDWMFALSPTYPSAGSHFAALLTGIDHHGMPVVQQCGADLSCSGASALPGSVTFSAPATLHMSSAYGHDGVVFAQSGRGLYKSIDGGVSFAPLTLPSDSGSVVATPMMDLDPSYAEAGPDRTVYVAEFETIADPRNPRSGGGVLRSVDGGATWKKLGSPSPLDGGAVAVAEGPDNRLFAGYLESSQVASGEGLLCSDDGGTSWHASCAALGSAANDPGPLPGSGPASSGGKGGTSSGSQAGGASTPGTAGGSGGGSAGSNGGGSSGGASNGALAGSTVGAHSGSQGGHTLLIIVAAVVAVGLAAAAWVMRRRGAAAVAEGPS
jgi:hypothetical protein